MASKSRSIAVGLVSSLLVVSGLLFAACGGTSGRTTTITGSVAPNLYRLNNPVVIAQSTSGKVFLAPVSRSMTFHLSVPSGATYRLLLANHTLDGKYRAISRINWSTAKGPSRWARVSSTKTIALGLIHPRGTAATRGVTSTNQGDDAQGENEDEQEDDGAVACPAQDESDSDCDQDHDNDIQGDDDSQDEDDAAGSGIASQCGCQLPPTDVDEQDDDDHLVVGTPSGTDGGACVPPAPPTGGGTDGGTPPSDGGTSPGGTPPASDAGTPPSPPPGGQGAPCTVNSDCSTGLVCASNICQAPLLR